MVFGLPDPVPFFGTGTGTFFIRANSVLFQLNPDPTNGYIIWFFLSWAKYLIKEVDFYDLIADYSWFRKKIFLNGFINEFHANLTLFFIFGNCRFFSWAGSIENIFWASTQSIKGNFNVMHKYNYIWIHFYIYSKHTFKK